MRDEGMRLPLKACPVAGSITSDALDEKSPARCADVGTVEYQSTGVREWLPE